VSTTAQPETTTQTTPAVFTVLPDGTVLYKTYQDAEAARLLKNGQQGSEALTHKSQVKLGEQYLTKDGQVVPYSMGGLVEFQVTGLIAVMVVLIALSLICSAIGRLLGALQKPEPSPVDVPTVSPTATSGMHPGLTDQHLVVLLTAAASQVLEGPVRVERFRPLTAKDMNWATQGRHALQDHRLNK